MVRNPACFLLLPLALFAASSCASNPAPPGPGEARGSVPDLRGHTVMVLPIQILTPVSTDPSPDEELAFALRTRGADVSWVFPPELDEILQRAPGVQARTRGLPVQVFLQAEVDRVGDPLFGTLVRMAALTGADVALIPVELAYGESGTFLLRAALVTLRTGRVSWFGVLEGAQGPPEDPGALVSVAEALAMALLPWG